MPQFYMFKCSTCKTPIKGPKVQPGKLRTLAIDTLLLGVNRPPGVACSTPGHNGLTYTGIEDLLDTLYELCQDPSIKTPTGGDNVAGYIDGTEFKFYKSKSLGRPAVVNAILGKAKSSNATVYTNRADALWIKDYPRMKVKLMDQLKPNEGDGAVRVTTAFQSVKKWPRQVAALALKAPLPDGGLYAAAAGLSKDLDLPPGSRKKGLARALRYYMLATYSLVDISSAEGYEGLKNYVGALLVSDQGQILAAGINTGSFRHAEVSMLLSYFRNNLTATKVPENSVIFSTLTPCKGCTGFLKVTKSSNCVIYFGQEDTGKDGRKGKQISTQLSEKTKTPVGRSKETLPGEIQSDDTDDTEGTGVVATGTASGIHKVQVDKGLTSCMGTGSIATQIGKAKHAKEVLRSGSEALIHKMLKTRAASDAENEVKQAVLTYIGQWLGTSKSVE
jgi:tRNA(Arg) A34 adenosine deaminase TadA